MWEPWGIELGKAYVEAIAVVCVWLESSWSNKEAKDEIVAVWMFASAGSFWLNRTSTSISKCRP